MLAIREAQREVDDARAEVARSNDVAQLLATLDVDKTSKVAPDVAITVLPMTST
jgi:hypothetical protein